MNPSELPSFELPQNPSSHNVEGSGVIEEDLSHNPKPEQTHSTQEFLVSSQSVPQQSNTPTKPLAMPSTTQTQQQLPVPATNPSFTSTSAIMAADQDLIEKEWVDKAKSIVNRTHGDPHKQNQEINKIKADYIKKRYNKDIKLSEE